MAAPASKITLPDEIKSGISSAIVVFVVTFTPTALGVLQSVTKWASTSGHTPLPGISTVGYAALSAALAAVGGLGTSLFRWAQSQNWLPGNPPQFGPPALSAVAEPAGGVSAPTALAPTQDLLAAIQATKDLRDQAQVELDLLAAALTPVPPPPAEG